MALHDEGRAGAGGGGGGADDGDLVPDGKVSARSNAGRDFGSVVSLECGYSNVRELQRIERALLRALAAASLERASGEIFRRPASVAADVKKEMVAFLNQQSEGYQLGEGEWNYSSDREPSATVDDMLEVFVKSKRNLFRRMSSKIGFPESKEDKVGEFVIELDRSGIWSLGQREGYAKDLLRRLDVHKKSHCERRLDTPEELAVHKNECLFRPLACENSGCGDVFSALQSASHDAECPYKLLNCKQGCEEKVMRMEMERHCSTVCLMKLVNCPFASVGCSHILPQGALEQHFSSMVSTHLMFVLQLLQKQELVVAGQAQRVSLLEKSLSLTERLGATDVNSLALTVKEQDAKIRKLDEELKKLRKEVTRSGDVSTKVTQLEKSMRTVQKQ